MSDKIAVIGMLVNQRAQKGPQVQEVLTRHGDVIIGRMGMPDAGKDHGLITLTVKGSDEGISALTGDLDKLDGVKFSSAILQ